MGIWNVCWSYWEVFVDAHGLKEQRSCFNQPQMYKPENSLTCVCVSFPFEPSCKRPPGLHHSNSSRGELHPIQEPGFPAVQAITSLLLWSIFHIKERMKEKEKKRGTEGKPERKTRGKRELKKNPRWLRGENTEEIKMERPRQERLVEERDRRSSSSNSTMLCVLPQLYK